MDWFISGVISASCVSMMLAGLYISIFFQYRERYFGIWTLGWALYFLRFMFLLGKITGIGNPLLMQLLTELSSFSVNFFILWGICIFILKPMPKWLFVGYVAGICWNVYGVFAQIPFMYLTLPSCIFVACSLIWGGWEILHLKISLVLGRNALGIFLILWGLHKANFPFLYHVEWFAPWGFIITALLSLGLALGMLLLYFQLIMSKIDEAQNTIKTLQGIIPICMHCKEIRDDEGCWNQLEKYISQHSEVKFSHSICDKCLEKHYP